MCANTLKIDFTTQSGKIKPMHAINNLPVYPINSNDTYERMQEANVPYARLHDTGGRYGGGVYVDVCNIFRNFDADVNDPDSYDFAFTDVLLKEAEKYGIKPFYRLGSTIENFHRIKAYNIYPPKDFKKWAEICEHIIMHYNYGWADGFNMDIKHWEIWNEPDNEPEICDNPMWKGTKEQFFEMYDITSKHLKKCFPDIMVGGYASCGFYAISNKDFSETAHSSSRVGYFIDFLNEFLSYAKENGSVLDFFSWHSYAGISDNVMYADYARKKLDSYEFNNAEIYLNEWNPGIKEKGKLKDASNILSMMIAMHNTSTDMLMYYDGQAVSAYCGIFNPLDMSVYKAYYAFYIFGRLYKMGNLVKTCFEGEKDVYAIAASGESKKGFCVVNNGDKNVEVKLELNDFDLNNAKLYAVDDTHSKDTLEIINKTEIFTDDNKLIIPSCGIIYGEI